MLLAQAGFPAGRGLPPITYLVDQDAQSLELANNLAAQWQRVLGVQVHLAQRNHSAYNLELNDRAYQIAVIDWTRDYPDPQNFLTQLLHSGYPNNNGDWRNPTFDRLVDEADHLLPDDPARLARYRQAEEIAMDQAAVIPLVHPTSGILLRPTIHGLQVDGGQILAVDWTRVTIAASSSS
jgi:ABC-type oligopeptide transport system substrate-binding subunit